MDIEDFQGLFKYKLFIPGMYVISWIMMFVGPSIFQVVYQRACIVCIIYLISRVFYQFLTALRATYKAWKVLNKVEYPENATYHELEEVGEKDIYHFIIIPSYKEDEDLIAATLRRIAIHTRAKEQYIVCMAMEAHEENSAVKAQLMIERFEGSFKHMISTQHVLKDFEQKGKASNVSWCAEHLEPVLKQLMVAEEDAFITVIDVDSWIPNIYYDEVETHIRTNWETRHKYIYAPPQMFTRNHLDVPVITRIHDIMHSCMHFTNLPSALSISFPLSNYTLSYSLIKRAGFWDTCADAIGEDFHTSQKCYWKTGGQVESVPVFAMFNQVNIQTGKGYCADVKARFWQAERHAQGVADVAYTFKMLFNQPLRWKTFIMGIMVIEPFFVPTVVTWMMFSLTYQSAVLFHFVKPSPQMYSTMSVSYLFNILSVLNILTYSCYEIIKRRSTRVLYSLENQSIFRIIELPIVSIINIFLVFIPSFILSAFGSLFEGRQYTVAEKLLKKPEM